ncbi:Na(+)/H(+) antiporter subunit D [Rhodobacteraceae bacterium D3-12]|nr:Na(+)/H(+) antiporter subunit D [Rhodobacteraceae bacterium D3-12]
MAEFFPPAFLFLAAAILLPGLPMIARNIVLLAAPLLSGWMIWSLPEGALAPMAFFGFELELLRVDPLARLFGLIFSLAAFLANLYAWHLRDTAQQLAALLYAGAAIGAVFAGDLISLFVFWEGTAIASVFLIWARGSEGAYHTGMRYLVVQIASGVLLLIGVALFYRETGSVAFDKMVLGSAASWLILIAFGIKCGFPLLHSWLSDAYPAATVTGSVILSVFTTKMAVYALARGFAGTEMLIYVGTVMALFPILYAIFENDLRRVLAFALISQLGFMVVGIGIGTELALNGAAAHAVASVLYKGLLFMAMGAVMFRTGTVKASALGGLYRTMPLTMLLCVVGAASISAMPLFSGFVTKSLTLSAAAKGHYDWVWGALLLASVGAVLHTGIRVPYAAFFAKDSGLRPEEAPFHMLVAMAGMAFFCVAIGVYPEQLYALLPFDVAYDSYTTTHVITQVQLVMFTLLGFVVLLRAGVFPQAGAQVTLGFDWVYRKAGPVALRYLHAAFGASAGYVVGEISNWAMGLYRRFQYSTGPEGRLAQTWPTGAMVLWIAILLGVTMFVNFVS